ncbi:hypothetical protein [Rhizobium aouanii]|uniref:Uncharacterized protein n=1 Tax=Rhizobium aouanii TaxID=3118145 RepID=A0ABU8CN24_9HYPH
MNRKGAAAPPSKFAKPRANIQEKARRSPWEGCTGPDVDRHALRGDGRSFAGREGLSRFFINNREAYWFHLLHNSLKRTRFEETLCGNSMCYSIFMFLEKTRGTEKMRRIISDSRDALQVFFHEACGLAGERKIREASILECSHRQFDVRLSRCSCFAGLFIAFL